MDRSSHFMKGKKKISSGICRPAPPGFSSLSFPKCPTKLLDLVSGKHLQS